METFYDIGSGDLKELWDTDLDPVSFNNLIFISITKILCRFIVMITYLIWFKSMIPFFYLIINNFALVLVFFKLDLEITLL